MFIFHTAGINSGDNFNCCKYYWVAFSTTIRFNFSVAFDLRRKGLFWFSGRDFDSGLLRKYTVKVVDSTCASSIWSTKSSSISVLNYLCKKGFLSHIKVRRKDLLLFYIRDFDSGLLRKYTVKVVDSICESSVWSSKSSSVSILNYLWKKGFLSYMKFMQNDLLLFYITLTVDYSESTE